MNQGDVLLARIAEAGGGAKLRPALLLRVMPGFGDLLVCGVSSQLRQAVPGFDEIVYDVDEDFQASGLKVTSVVRLGHLTVLPREAFSGKIGAVSEARYRRLLGNLIQYLGAED